MSHNFDQLLALKNYRHKSFKALLADELGTYQDFFEVLKVYDKHENGGKIMLGELENILLTKGEKLERSEMDILIEECCEQPDEDGYFPYEGSGLSNSGQPCSRCYKKLFPHPPQSSWAR